MQALAPRPAYQKFAVEVTEEPPVTEALWEAAGEIFQHAADAAIRRGEYVMVEPGGWETVRLSRPMDSGLLAISAARNWAGARTSGSAGVHACELAGRPARSPSAPWRRDARATFSYFTSVRNGVAGRPSLL